jgi:hypothetical protein
MAGTGRGGSQQGGEGLIVAGMLLGILMPPIGLAIGAVVLSRGDRRGWWPIGLAVGILLMAGIVLLRTS